MKKVILFFIFSLLFSFNVSAMGDISAKSAVLINGTTGEIIYAKNENEQLPMASTTKIMTSLLLAETDNMDKEVIVTKEMITVEGSSMGLLPGDTITYRDLLYGMLLASGNDAANSVAYLLGGNIEGFAKLMNLKAKEIGLLHTNFVTPSGLDDENHYTTAVDLAKLARFAMQNDKFSEAAGSKSAVLNYGNPPYRRQITNHNKLLNLYDGVVGVKTGFTKKSGRCLVSAAKKDAKYLIAVTLNAPSDWQDHVSLLDYGFNNLKPFTLRENSTIEIPVISGDKTYVSVDIPKQEIALTNENTADFETFINLPDFLYAPLGCNEKIGEFIVKYKNETIVANDLFCKEEIRLKSTEETFLQKTYKMFLLFIKELGVKNAN